MKKTDDQIAIEFRASKPKQLILNGVFVKSEQTFYLWDGVSYNVYGEESVKQDIWDFLIDQKEMGFITYNFNITAKKVDEVYEALKLDHKKSRQDTCTPFVSFTDGKILDLETFELFEASADIPSFFKLDGASTILDGEYECPRFLSFLKEVLVGEDGVTPDDELINFVQEIFGYCLTGSVKAHATFFFFGSGRNGKSVLLDVLRKLVGDPYISNMTIQALTTNRFSAFGLTGKKLNIASEEESKWIKSDMFKSLVAGDPITVERKYRDPVEYRPSVKFVFGTNVIPVFDSTDPAIRDRVFIVPFNRYFKESERDPDLTEKLDQEIAGIFAWALEGAKRIVENKYRFTRPDSVSQMADRFQKEQSSVLTFFEENYVVTDRDEDFVAKIVMYGAYKAWCKENNRKPKGDSRFYKDLNNIYRRRINTEARRSINGSATRVVLNVRMTDDKSAFILSPISSKWHE